MKILIPTLGLATALVFATTAGPIRAQDGTAAPPPDNAAPGDNSSVSFQTFYDQLANQGTWVQTDQYGYVFQPTETNPDWRPYTYGHWVNTDAGMTWVSDDSFGWATDHYGRWVNLANYGWVWVPGSTWAPAWVSWRQGGDDVGWAPLPPDSSVGIDYYGGNSFDVGLGFLGFHIGDDCDTAYGIGPECYNFCPIAYIGDRDCWHHFRDRRDNFAYINETRNITNINVNRDRAGRFGHVRAEGPSVAALNARAHTRIANATLTSANRRDAAGLHGNTLAVYAPRIDRNTIAHARPATVSAHLAHVAVNRGTDINHPLAVNSHLAPAAATAAQAHAAAQERYSADARVATTSTRISHPLSQPLTAMRTAPRSGATSTQHNERFTGTTTPATHTAAVSPESSFTGEPAKRHETPSVADRSFTGEPASAQRHEAAPAVADRRYTAKPAQRHETATSVAEHSFTGEPAEHRETVPVEHHASTYAANSAPAYHPKAAAPVFHQSAPAYHPQASAPTFHPSAPAYHPQASFHAAAPAPHFSGGGGFHGGGAPAAHAGGGGGGAHPSGGGAKASAGNAGKH